MLSDNLILKHFLSRYLIAWLLLFGVLVSVSGAQEYGEQADLYAPVDNGVPEGHKLIQGDIIVPQDYDCSDGTLTTELWSNGLIPYLFSPNVTPQNQQLALDAMTEWQHSALLNFFERTDEPNWIFIQNATENSSMVGMQGGMQVVNIKDWSKFIIVHELGHALGMWHEQCRPDRDVFVTINWGNIESGKEHNFYIISSAKVYPKTLYNLEDEETYDFDSIMHYDQYAFSKNGMPTITVKPPNQHWQELIGQLDHLSFLDQLTMSFLYPEPGWSFVDWSTPELEYGSFFNPWKTFILAMTMVQAGSTLKIQPGGYAGLGTWNKAMTLEAPLGHVLIGDY